MAIKEKRSTTLLAEFEDGFAKGWYFAIGEFFKDQLDIKRTERTENGVKKLVWTQGHYYCFDQGQILYDHKNAYSKWQPMPIDIKYMIQILTATPNTKENNIIQNGYVNFKLLEIDIDRTKFNLKFIQQISQDEFVQFLQNGIINGESLS